jgi:hypothetical protein
MRKIFIGLIIGLLVGGVGALSLGGGMMAGVGVATGLSSGVCITIDSARKLNLITDAQADDILNHAARALGEPTDAGEQLVIVGSAEQCDDVLKRLRNST